MLCTDRPLREEVFTMVFIDLLNPSTIKINMNRERGFPCLIPLDGLKVDVGAPFGNMEKKEEEMSQVIH